MKSSPESKKPSLLGRLKAGIKRLISADEKSGAASKEKSRGKATAAARTKRDLFPKEAGAERPAREARLPHAERVPRTEKREPAARIERPARTGERQRQSERPQRDERQRRGERSGTSRGGRGDGNRGPRPERGAGEVRGPGGPITPKAPPAQPPEPAGPFPEAFAALGLSPRMLAGVRDMGYTTPTTIQAKAIPVVIDGRDVIGASQTGTGKTAAFGLPIMSRLGPPAQFPRVLVLEPTRELALQVVDHLERISGHTGLRTLAIYGGVGYGKQREGLQSGVDILVATPGRLLDFMSDGTIRLDTIEELVLDEVDRMLDMGFLPDVRKIVEKCPRERQTLFFSATMPAQIKTLADWALRTPVEIEVGLRFSPADTVSHYFYPVAADQREELLIALLDDTHWHSVMIFTRTKVQADRLYASIKTKGDYKAAVMHSDIAQRDREKALAGFREGTFDVIVATDLAARGLDISGVTHVINFMVPENPEDYVHRIGRTGRAQKEGDAFTLMSADELDFAEAIERLIGQKIERRKLESFPYEYTALLDPDAGSADKFKKLFRSAKPGKKRRR